MVRKYFVQKTFHQMLVVYLNGKNAAKRQGHACVVQRPQALGQVRSLANLYVSFKSWIGQNIHYAHIVL